MDEIDIARLRQLTDRQEIADCIFRATRGMDRHDTELARSAFFDDSRDDHASFIGTAYDMIDWVNQFHDAALRTHLHYLGPMSVDLGDYEAHTETYCWSVGVRKGSWENVYCGGRYLDRLEKRDGRWGIVDRITVVEWWSSADSMEFMAPLSYPHSQDRSDPSYMRPLQANRPFRDVSDPSRSW